MRTFARDVNLSLPLIRKNVYQDSLEIH